ncbi:MAG: hypothetical protein Q9226_006150, partial [Calogaya cf. arnoldii]
MAGQNNPSVFGSRVFQIVVGPSAKTLYAHAGVLISSGVLQMVIYGGGKEMEEGKIVWPDWTVGGAERFLEWLYTGDYQFPYPRPVSASKDGSKENGDSFSVDDELVEGVHGRAAPRNSMASSSKDSQNKEASATEAVKRGGELTKEPLTCLQDLTWPGFYTPKSNASHAEKFDNWVGHEIWNADRLDYEAMLLAHAEL